MALLAFILPILFVIIIYLARMMELGVKRDTEKGPVQENLSLTMFIAAGTLMLLGSIFEYILLHKTLSWPFLIAGLACAIASFMLRQSAIRALGRFWSLHVEIRPTHEMVISGPFRWVRHPTYLSMILELLAVALALKAYITVFIIPFFFVPALLYRLRLEETALLEKFGDNYRAYQKRVPALLPLRPPLPPSVPR